jgi:ribosomal protein S18 acetylase RimI-like enzyme
MWRPMRIDDLVAVVELADEIHASYPEDPAIFAERLRLYPDGCFVLDINGVRGYAISHPWAGDPPKLNKLLGSLPVEPDTYYLHDIALHPSVRAKGHAQQIVDQIVRRMSPQYRNITAVAVEGTLPTWRRMGFEATEVSALSYGPGARHIMRHL